MQPTFRQVPPKVDSSMIAICQSSTSGVTSELPEPEPMIARSKCAGWGDTPPTIRPHGRADTGPSPAAECLGHQVAEQQVEVDAGQPAPLEPRAERPAV